MKLFTYIVTGLRRETGDKVVIDVKAVSKEHAIELANERGVVVELVSQSNAIDSALSEPGGCVLAVLVLVSCAFWALGSIGLLMAFVSVEANEKADFLTPAVWVAVGFLSFICYLLLTLIDAVASNKPLAKDQPSD